jgi:xylulose-5-phosphate/fructose-6-phosphate phosphoketolase
MNAPTLSREQKGQNDVAAPAVRSGTLSSDELHKMDAYWRAANYLSVGQIYLYDNPLLREPLTLAQGCSMLCTESH